MRDVRGAVLQTAHLELAPLGEGDVPALHALWTTPGVRRFLWDGRTIALEQTEQLVARSAALQAESGLGLWGARRPGEPALIGFAGFWFFRSEAELELMYGLAETDWGRGYGRELAQAMVAYAFDALGLPEVRASTEAANTASLRILQRLGFLRQHAGAARGSSVQHFVLPRGVYRGIGLDEEHG